jgi:hypothetical protein
MDTTPQTSTLCPPHHWLIEETLHIQHWACYRCQTTRDLPQEHWRTARWVINPRPRPAVTVVDGPVALPAG